MDAPILERFMSKVLPEPNSGCWLWATGLDSKGYGRFGSGSKKTMRLSHRMAYEHFVGSIPVGLFVCHKCDVRSCVNPDHMFLGNHQDNMTDRNKKARQARGTKQHIAKINEDIVRYIRSSPKNGTELADEVGINQSSVSAVRTRRTWKHVE